MDRGWRPGARGATLWGLGGCRRTAAAAWKTAHKTVILKSAMLSVRGQAVLWRQCERAEGLRPQPLGLCHLDLVPRLLRCRNLQCSATGSRKRGGNPGVIQVR